jgi:hypothetical protein
MFRSKKESEFIELFRINTDEMGEISSIGFHIDTKIPSTSSATSRYFRVEDVILQEGLSALSIRSGVFSEWRPRDIHILSLRIMGIPSHVFTDQRRMVEKEKRITQKWHLDSIVTHLGDHVTRKSSEIKSLDFQLKSLDMIDSELLRTLTKARYKNEVDKLRKEIDDTVKEVEKYLKENSSKEMLKFMKGLKNGKSIQP